MMGEASSETRAVGHLGDKMVDSRDKLVIGVQTAGERR